jgi:hypothetical protein
MIDQKVYRAWQRIIRDTLLVSIGAFMLVYETVATSSPDPYVIAGGLAALGLPPAIRLDFRGRVDKDDSDD